MRSLKIDFKENYIFLHRNGENSSFSFVNLFQMKKIKSIAVFVDLTISRVGYVLLIVLFVLQPPPTPLHFFIKNKEILFA